MRGRMLIFALLLLAGCRKDGGPNFYPGVSTMQDQSLSLFVGGGQSQMSRNWMGAVFSNYSNRGVGGSYLREWMPGTPYLQEMIDTCKRDGRWPCVFFFWQGESDAQADGDLNWGQDFVKIVREIRAQVGYEAPVIYAQIGQTSLPGFPYWKEIQDQQSSVRWALPKLAMVESKDLFPETGDGIHYTQDQFNIVAQRALKAWQDL